MQWLVTRLLELAVRRWPVQVREELAREWAAELYALGQEDRVAAPVRVWRQLWFAASLAAARPHSADPGLLGWLRRPSAVRAHTVWLVFAPVLALLGTAMMMVPLVLLFGSLTLTPILLAVFMTGKYAVQGVVAASFGILLGRRFLRRVGQPSGVAGYVRATLPLIGGLLLVDGLARASGQEWAGSWLTAIAALCLAFVLPPLAAGAAVLARRQRVLAVFLAVLTAPALTLAIAYLLVLLAPRPASGVGAWWWLGYLGQRPLFTLGYISIDTQLPIETILPFLPSFLFTTTVLALAQAIRLARPLTTPLARRLPAARVGEPAATTLAPESPDTIPAIAASPWWHRIALAGAVYSVLAWAVTLTYLTPNIGVQNSWPSRLGPDGTLLPTIPAGWPQWNTEEGRVWMHELQLSAIVCAALCLLLAAAYLGRPLLPTLAASAVLLAVNMVVVRAGATTIRLLPWLAAGGLLLGMAAWWAATRKRPDPHPHQPRRLVITITVLTAFLVPGSFFPRFYIVPGVQAPPVLLAVAVGLPTILTILAAMGVLATSTRLRRGPGWLLPAGLALLPAIGGILLYQDSLIRNDYEPSFSSYLMRTALPALALPMAAWTIAAIRARPATPQRLALHVTLAPLLLAVGWPVTMATFITAMILSRLVLFPMEYGRAYDGIVYLPGAIAIGLLLGNITAARLTRPSPTPPTPSRPPAPATDHIDLAHPPPGPA